MGSGAGQTRRGYGPIVTGPKAKDMGGNKGVGDEPLRQADGGGSLTTHFPSKPTPNARDVGAPGAEATGRTNRGYVLNEPGVNPTVEDGNVADDGRRTIRDIPDPGGQSPMGSPPAVGTRNSDASD